MKFYATSEHKTYEFKVEVEANGYIITNADGQQFEASIEHIENDRYSLLLNNESFIVNANKLDDTYTTIIRGKQFELQIDDEKSKAWKSILNAGSAANAEVVLKSPMPGLVVKILVETGQEIKKGDPLLVLSAMKMENEIKAKTDCIVETIHCTENKAVEKNELLISFLQK
jgi:biotin carboxyl carrier protein